MVVYLLTNSVNGKYYVGQTTAKSLRWYLHRIRSSAKCGTSHRPIVNAVVKYGFENFKAEILAIADTLEQLNLLERLWIISLDSRNPKLGYNVTSGGDDTRRGLHNSEEHNKRIAAASRGRTPVGYVRTDMHKQQIRDRVKSQCREGGRYVKSDN